MAWPVLTMLCSSRSRACLRHCRLWILIVRNTWNLTWMSCYTDRLLVDRLIQYKEMLKYCLTSGGDNVESGSDAVSTIGSPILWIGFTLLVLALLALDLGVFHRKTHIIGFREALGWSVFWITLALFLQPRRLLLVW